MNSVSDVVELTRAVARTMLSVIGYWIALSFGVTAYCITLRETLGSDNKPLMLLGVALLALPLIVLAVWAFN